MFPRPLPNETEVCEAIPHKLRKQLTISYELLEFGLNVQEQEDPHSGSFPRDAVVTCMGLLGLVEQSLESPRNSLWDGVLIS